jgi:hypothetical protein
LITYNDLVFFAMIDEATSHQNQAPFFIIGNQSVLISPSHIIVPGAFGNQPNIFIKCPETGMNIIARFVGFSNETYCPETDQTTVFFEVIIRGTSELRIVQMGNICPFFPTSKQIEEHDSRLLSTRLRNAHGSNLRFPLNTEWGYGQLTYPLFNPPDIFVLWNLTRSHDVKIGFEYKFNRLVIRLLACGPQNRYFEDGIEGVVSALSRREQVEFLEFMRIYTDHMMGTTMASKSQRCSTKSVLQIFMEEFSHAKACNASSTFALELPASYFMRQEPWVTLVALRDGHVPHSSLSFPIPVENPE